MSDDDEAYLMVRVRVAAEAAALVIDANEQLDTYIVQRNAEYAKLMADHRRQGHRWAKGHSAGELARLVANELYSMGYNDQRQRDHGITVNTLRKFVTVEP